MYAHPRSIWFRRLIYYIAAVDYSLMRRDAKRVAEWDIERIVPCHGDIIDGGGNEAWTSAYEWFMHGDPERSTIAKMRAPFMRVMRWLLLM
jgi:hypothetical protein